LRQKKDESVTIKAKGIGSINPHQAYHVALAYDGSDVSLVVDGTVLTSIHPIGVLSGTVGYESKNTTARFADLCVK
jgi:hypothetical protein